MRYLDLRSCFGIDASEREAFLQGSQMSDIFQSTFGRAPTQQELDQMTQNATYNGKAVVDLDPGSYSAYLSGTPEGQQKAVTSAMNQAQQMQLQANQPAISTFQSQYNPDTGTGTLVDKYNTLLDSISASQAPAQNAQTVATENELGRRGITSDSGVGQNQLASSLLPISTQFGQLKANTGVAEQGDLTNIAAQIAGLRAGNVPNALSFASNIGQQQTALQSANIQAQAQIQAQQLASNAMIQAATIGNQRPFALMPGAGAYNPVTNAITGQTSFTPSAFTQNPTYSGGNNTSSPVANYSAPQAQVSLTSPGSSNAGPQINGFINGAPSQPAGKMGNVINSNLFPSGIGLR